MGNTFVVDLKSNPSGRVKGKGKTERETAVARPCSSFVHVTTPMSQVEIRDLEQLGDLPGGHR